MGNRRRQRRTAPMTYSTDGPHVGWLLDGMAALGHAAAVALLLVAGCDRGPLLTSRDGRRDL
jgi:hypothetical protein